MSSVTDRIVEVDRIPGPQPLKAGRTLVIGIGNLLMSDDGAGIHVIDSLRRHSLPDHVELIDGGTLSFTLLETVESAERLIIVDAAELDAAPGTVRAFHDRDMDVYLGSANRPSVHEVNLLDVLTAARLRGRMPSRYSLIGIQPAQVGWGDRPSDALAGSIDKATRIVLELLEDAT